MSKALRLSEKWFRRGLWLVAVVFASFLIGLGGTIVGDLPKVERPLQVDDFLDKAQARALRDTIRAQREAEQDAQTALEQAQLQHRKAISDNQAERETFNNWLVWCLKSNHQIIELAARATDAKMVSALLCHTNGLGSSL